MSALESCEQWATRVFSFCDLGDKRRLKRLIIVVTQLAKRIGSSLSKSCEGDASLVEGAYRLI